MDNMEILKTLCEVFSKGTGDWSEPLTCDRLDQEQLFKIQTRITVLMGHLARKTPGGIVFLEKQFPHVFRYNIARVPH